MNTYAHIDVDSARKKLEGEAAVFVDIRDDESRRNGHIAQSVHLTQQTVDAFLQGADPTQPVIVYCYHGNMSRSAAQFLVERGFSEVYSMDGGYEAWANNDAQTG